jgi:hypothetical protein
MRIIDSIKAGFARSLKAWKGIVIVWFITLAIVSLVALPMKGALKDGLGDSMITEKLANGINVEVFADLGANFSSLNSYFLSGLLMIVLISFITNAFLSGGLFNSLKDSSGIFSPRNFFMASAKYFWSFFLISLILDLIILLLVLLIIVIPVSIVVQTEVSSEGALFKTLIVAASVFLMVLIWLLVVADYARAWQVSQKRSACFKALGFGFRQIYRTFFSSYPLMLILIFVQLLFGSLVLYVLSGMKPATGTGIILLFLLSQIFFFIKVMLKAWRYGSVTRMMETSSATAK